MSTRQPFFAASPRWKACNGNQNSCKLGCGTSDKVGFGSTSSERSITSRVITWPACSRIGQKAPGWEYGATHEFVTHVNIATWGVVASKAFILRSRSPRTVSTCCPRFFWDTTLTEPGKMNENSEVTWSILKIARLLNTPLRTEQYQSRPEVAPVGQHHDRALHNSPVQPWPHTQQDSEPKLTLQTTSKHLSTSWNVSHSTCCIALQRLDSNIFFTSPQ